MEDRALVVGAGSIGLRHQRVLSGLGVVTDLVSRRPEPQGAEQVRIHAELGPALRSVKPTYVVIATETAAHLRVIEGLAREGFQGRVLIEKPLAAAPLLDPTALQSLPFRTVAVGYQLRFHPTVVAARTVMASDRIVAIDAYVGQHLAAWRPGRSVALDLLAATVSHRSLSDDVDRPATVQQHLVDRDGVLATMHSAMLADDVSLFSSLDQGMELVRLIDAIERSVTLGNWIAREDSR